jgi:hypothetical protein
MTDDVWCGMAIAKIESRKKLSKGRLGVVLVDADDKPLSFPMGTVLRAFSGGDFRVTRHHHEDGEFTSLYPLSDTKLPGDVLSYETGPENGRK